MEALASCPPNAPPRGQPPRRLRMRPVTDSRPSGPPSRSSRRQRRSRALPQHESLVDLTPRDAAGGRDRPGDRSGSDETKGAGLDMAASASPSGRGPASRRMLVAAGVRPAPLRRSVDIDWPGLRFNRVASVASVRSGLKSIFIVADPSGFDRFPKRSGERVDRAAFEAGARDHRLAANAHPGVRERDIFERRAGEGFPDPRGLSADELERNGHRNLDGRIPSTCEGSATGCFISYPLNREPITRGWTGTVRVAR